MDAALNIAAMLLTIILFAMLWLGLSSTGLVGIGSALWIAATAVCAVIAISNPRIRK